MTVDAFPTRRGVLDEPPLEAERSVLAAMMLDHGCIGRARELLESADFALLSHRKIFEALVALHCRGQKGDLVTTAEELKKRGDLDVVGGPPALGRIMDQATTSTNLEAHAAIVRTGAWRRDLRRVGLELVREVDDPTLEVPDIAARVEGHLRHLATPLDGADSRGLTITRLSTVEPRRLSWLWYHRIPLGMVTILAGDGGLGKTTVALDLSARVTRGQAMPDGTEGLREPAGVVVLSSEDALDSVLVPRLSLADADLSRVTTVTVKTAEGDERRLIITPADLVRLESVVRAEAVRLVILDPLAAFVDEAANLHHNQDARRVLAQLHALAERRGIAILGIHHFNRGQHQDAVHRLTGSAGIANAARSVLVVGTDTDEPSGERMVLAVAKRNLAPRTTPSLAYRLVVSPGGEHPVVSWEGPCSKTANDLVATPADPEDRDDLDDAVGQLRNLLADGPMLVKEVQREIKGIPERAVRKAKKRLGVVSERQDPRDPRSPWVWRLPEIAYTTRPPVLLSPLSHVTHCEPDTGTVGRSADTRTDGQAGVVSRARAADEPPLEDEPPGWLERPRFNGRAGLSADQRTLLAAHGWELAAGVTFAGSGHD